MKNSNLYVALDCRILIFGIENLIKSNYNTVNLFFITPDDNLLDQSKFNIVPGEREFVLICDPQMCPNFKLRINKLLKQYPFFKIIILTDNFDVEETRLLFKLGVSAVIDKNLDPKEFIKVFEKTVNDKKSLSKGYIHSIIKQFCKTNPNFDIEALDSVTEVVSEKKSLYHSIFDLTKRETQVLDLISKGLNTQDIADQLFISQHTVETHRCNLLSKMNVKNAAQLVRVAFESKILVS